MIRSFYLITCFLLVTITHISAQISRQTIDLNEGWTYYPAYNVNRDVEKIPVTLPHTWNASDVLDGKINYSRETMIYQRKLELNPDMKDKRLFLYFEGANSVAQILVNQQVVGVHHGGYTAFCYEVTDFVDFEKPNLLTAIVSNAFRTDVLPLSGDFNVFGGLHRPAHLIVTGKNCISPLDCASPGVYLTQNNVSEKSAGIEVKTMLSLKDPDKKYQLKTTVYNGENRVYESLSTIPDPEQESLSVRFTMKNPVLWNGKQNPHLYRVKVELLQEGIAVDEIIQPLGIRYFTVDPQKGFFLNGKYLNLYGFGRHEDLAGKGSALTREDYESDMELMKEIGVTTMRLTHYPHGEPIYDLCDQNGIVLWTEIPFVGPGGYTGPGYIRSEALENHARTTMTELIRQKYNHPSICFWGLFNELKLDYDHPVPFLTELNQLVKKEDPYRYTTCASFLDNETFNYVSDLIAWNKYYGWYGGKFEDIGVWADKIHSLFPEKPIAVSEYGAGASISQHTAEIKAPAASGKFHPEGWQTLYHEKHWEEMSKRPFIWGKYIWVWADFTSSIRDEGDRTGMNDKGLLTYDRKTKKDAFFFYKANWNPEPVIYIADRRFTERVLPVTEVKVFTNIPECELFVNGKSQGKKKKDAFNRIVWNNITLTPGKNEISVRAAYKKQLLTDTCEWLFTEK